MIGLALSPADAALMLTTIDMAQPFMNDDEMVRLKGVHAALTRGLQDVSQDGTP